VDLSATLAQLPAANAADPARYALGGVAPAAARRPAGADEAAAIVRACSEHGLGLVPWGGGVTLAHERAPGRYDLALDLSALDRVTIFEPDDFTVTAECGVTLDALRAALAAHGQELPLEGAAPARATLGGVLAANASGPRRLRFGSPRDRVLGARFVTGDGVLARTGGRVVKNVAGHAVHRLLVGSRGGLGVLLEASLKLLPAPPARACLVHGLDAMALADAARWRGFARREPTALTVLAGTGAAAAPFATGASFTVVTGWEGDPAWVDACVEWTIARLGRPASLHRDRDAEPIVQALADAAEAPATRLTLASAHNSPTAIAALPAATALVFHAPAGRLEITPRPGGEAALLEALMSRGFEPIDVRGLALELPAPSTRVRALRAQLAAALDPRGVMAFGPHWKNRR